MIKRPWDVPGNSELELRGGELSCHIVSMYDDKFVLSKILEYQSISKRSDKL